MKTIYVVSYTVYSGCIFNSVHAFSTKECAIKSANAYIKDANENVSEEFKSNQNFNNYEFVAQRN